MEFKAGMTGSLEHRVAAGDLATQWGNDLEVLCTPTLFGLAEVACMRATADAMPEGAMTVGIGFAAQHLAPTPVGAGIVVTAVLEAIDGKKLRFAVTASDGLDIILRGTHDRAVVSADRFRQRVIEKTEALAAVGVV